VKLKLDENLGRRVADRFRVAGHDVTTVAGQGLAGATDENVIRICREEQRGLVTLDSDFGNPLIFNPADYSGIAVLRLPSRSDESALLVACQTLIVALDRQEFVGRLWSVERGRIREYRPDASS
jgi:predicted nuclease of predicted toxin-antitoxin system